MPRKLMDRDNVEYAIHLHCKKKASFMKVLDADSGIVFSSSSTCMKESDNQKKKKKKRRTDVDGDICKRRALGRGFSSDDCVFCFSRSRECVIELSFPEEREGERAPLASVNSGANMAPSSSPPLCTYTLFFSFFFFWPPSLVPGKKQLSIGGGKETDRVE